MSDAFIYLTLQQRLQFAPSVFPLLYVATSLVYAGFAAPAGRLADRFGSRRVFLVGYVALGIVYLSLLLARGGGGQRSPGHRGAWRLLRGHRWRSHGYCRPAVAAGAMRHGPRRAGHDDEPGAVVLVGRGRVDVDDRRCGHDRSRVRHRAHSRDRDRRIYRSRGSTTIPCRLRKAAPTDMPTTSPSRKVSPLHRHLCGRCRGRRRIRRAAAGALDGACASSHHGRSARGAGGSGENASSAVPQHRLRQRLRRPARPRADRRARSAATLHATSPASACTSRRAPAFA